MAGGPGIARASRYSRDAFNVTLNSVKVQHMPHVSAAFTRMQHAGALGYTRGPALAQRLNGDISLMCVWRAAASRAEAHAGTSS
jgi:hypothetical protein